MTPEQLLAKLLAQREVWVSECYLGLDEDEADDGDGKVDLADTDRGRATPVAQDPDEESAI